MKNISLRASRCAVVLSMSFACALPVMAQSTTGSGATSSGTTGSSTTSPMTTDNRNDNKDHNYGWLGLLGLLGLAGLRKKTDDRTDEHRMPTTSR